MGKGKGERAVKKMNKTKELFALASIIGVCIAVSVLAQPMPSTPFVIHGYVFYDDGSECKNPLINITNLNSGAKWQAETNHSSNYYQLVLANGTSVNASETLLFAVKSHDGNQSNITHRTVTSGDINNGGIFDLNITLEAPPEVPLVFDTGEPVNPYPSISGTHNGTITPYVTIYSVSTLYTYSCPGTGGHTEHVAFYYPNGTKKIAEGHWNGYTGDWHNITISPAFTMQANHTYYYAVRTGSYPQIHHTDELPAEEEMGIINCTSFVDANGRSYNNWIPTIRLEGKLMELPVHNIDTGKNFSTIQAAIDDLGTQPRHIIVVDAGTYIENVNVTKQLTLRGIGMPTVKAYASGSAITLTADGCVLEGFNVTDAGIGSSPPDYDAGIKITSNGNVLINNTASNNYCGIFLRESSNNTLTNNIANSNSYTGILLKPALPIFDNPSFVHNNTLINNTMSKNEYGIFLSHLSNNTLTNNTANSNRYHGIFLSYSSNNTLTNNTFVNDGLYTHESYKNIVENNIVNGKPLVYLEDASDIAITDADAGQVILVNCNNITIERLNLSNTDVGIELWKTNNSKITNNIISNLDNGLYLYHSSNNNITNNKASNNSHGIGLYYSSNNSLTNNVASNNWAGIDLFSSSYNTVINNTVISNDNIGISLYTSSYNTLTKNLASNNCRGIYLELASNNTIYNNNFMNNSINVNYSYGPTRPTNIWNTTSMVTYTYNGSTFTNYLGNYWSDYTGSDTNNDGIGNIPYSINSDKDNHPLMEPWEKYKIK